MAVKRYSSHNFPKDQEVYFSSMRISTHPISGTKHLLSAIASFSVHSNNEPHFGLLGFTTSSEFTQTVFFSLASVLLLLIGDKHLSLKVRRLFAGCTHTLVTVFPDETGILVSPNWRIFFAEWCVYFSEHFKATDSTDLSSHQKVLQQKLWLY